MKPDLTTAIVPWTWTKVNCISNNKI